MAVLPARASPVRGRFRLELADSANRPNGHPTRAEATPSLMHCVDNKVGRRCRTERLQTKIRSDLKSAANSSMAALLSKRSWGRRRIAGEMAILPSVDPLRSRLFARGGVRYLCSGHASGLAW